MENRFNFPPQALLTHQRFDIPAKCIYARFREHKIDSNWGEQVYAQHLKVWNNLSEKRPPKSGLAQYLAVFGKILDDVRDQYFDFDKSPVLLTKERHVLNGGHRAAAAVYYDRPVIAQFAQSGGMLASHQYFENRRKFVREGLNPIWCDAIATEFCRLKRENIYLIALFPTASDRQRSEAVISEHCDIVYRRPLSMTERGTYALMSEIYLGEDWIGSPANDFRGARRKAERCFRGQSEFVVYLVTASTRDGVLECKQRVRDIFKVDHDSIHTTDTTEEVRRLANVLFNSNSIHFLNRARSHNSFQNFNAHFGHFKRWLAESELNPEELCVDGSGVLAAYGLRDSRDIDVLHRADFPFQSDCSKISSHNKEVRFYETTLDDILFNPCNHFWYNGVKFASPGVTRAMKRKRNEPKDRRDVALLDYMRFRSAVSAVRARIREGSRSSRLRLQSIRKRMFE